MKQLLVKTKRGLFCPQGDFYIDPWMPVPLAVITHAHGDHARSGSRKYLAQKASLEILKYRLNNADVQTYAYGEKFKLGNVWVSFHPAGHILGSSQIRIESQSNVAVVSGDYKREFDESCAPFELLVCDLFVTESTFALPIYHWEDPHKIGESIYQWWQSNAQLKKTSVLFCYTLGKTQRILSMLRKYTDKEIYIHGSIAPYNEFYANQGIQLAKTRIVTEMETGHDFAQELIMAPSLAFRSPWMRRFKSVSTAFASGWMAVRGMRRRMGYDKGFVLSDHADWHGLLRTIQETQAKQVWVQHGFNEILTQYLREELGIDAKALTGFMQEEVED